MTLKPTSGPGNDSMGKYTNFYFAALFGCGAALCLASSQENSRPGTPFRMDSAEKGFIASKTNRPDNPPQRITSGGTSLFGFMSSSDISSMNPPRGLYEIGQYGETSLVYDDPGAQYYDKFSCAFLLDGYLYGYAGAYFSDDFANFGTPAFLKVDFKTGEVIYKEDIDSSISWSSQPAYNPEDGYFYFFTGNSEMARATVTNPTAVEIVKKYDNYMDNVVSLAYCPKDGGLYGVNLNHRFVKIDFDGTQTIISDIPDKSAHSTFQSAMTYAPLEDIFYWTYQSNDGTTSLYTVTTQGMFNFECALDDNACFDWFVTPDRKITAGAPGVPTIDGLDFPYGSLSGSITFSMPEAMQDESPMPENLDWRVSVDGSIVSEGTAAPASKVIADIKSLNPGNHEFGVTVSANGISCETVSRRAWIGNDTPIAPSSVTLSPTSVSWEAPSAGVHGGYIDLEALTYSVRIDNMSGKTVFAASTDATEINYSLENPDDLSMYTAYVSVSCNGLESSESNSNGVVMGTAMTPPVRLIPTKAEFEMMSGFDKNEDGTCWMWNDERNALYSGYTYDDSMPMDDYIFLPAMTFDNTERIYQISLDASAWSPNFSSEYLDVVLAIEPNYDGVFESLIERTLIPCAYDLRGNQVTEWKKLQGNFMVQEPGVYYIGIHCSSAAQMAGVLVRNIYVNDGAVTGTSPDTPEDIVAAAAPEGELSAKVSFRFPMSTIDGTKLPEGEPLTATIDSPAESVKTTGYPGESTEVTLATVQGENEIGITVTDDNGGNSFRATVKVFTGQNVPSNVTNVKGEVSDDMLHLKLFWNAPTTGVNNGYIDPSQLSYNIYMYDAAGVTSKWTLLEKGVSECNFTFTPEYQDYYRIAIEPVNIAGSGPMMSGSAWVGPPYTLPFSDNFSHPTEIHQTKPWRIFTDGHHAEWTFMYLKDVDPALFGASNDKIAMYCSGTEGTTGRVSMPRFSTIGQDDVRLELEVYTGSKAAGVKLYGYSTHHSDQLYEIGTLPSDSDEKLSTVSFNIPKELCGEPWVQILIDTAIEDEGDYFAMTSASVSSTDGVQDIMNGAGSITAGRRSVRLQNLKGKNVTIASADGRTVVSMRIKDNDTELPLPPGTYAVEAGGISLKTIIR